jgi:hypothetical protein
MEKNGTRLKTNNSNLGHIHGHNLKKMTHSKTQIISYRPSMTNINTTRLIDYHKILSA